MSTLSYTRKYGFCLPRSVEPCPKDGEVAIELEFEEGGFEGEVFTLRLNGFAANYLAREIDKILGAKE